MNKGKVFLNGFITENPILVSLLGMCATLGTSSSAETGMGMGLATTFVLVCSNIVISLLKSVIPDGVRIPAFIVVIAAFTTIVQMVVQAYAPALYSALGIFLPLIVVNCIVLGRAESFASKHGVADSLVDGLGSGLGFTLVLVILGAIREILGSGKIFGQEIFAADYGTLVFVLAPGGFIVLGYMIAVNNVLVDRRKKREARKAEEAAAKESI
jgi:electron transport complex protein RnfE